MSRLGLKEIVTRNGLFVFATAACASGGAGAAPASGVDAPRGAAPTDLVGEFSSDVPGSSPSGGVVCKADYESGGRNPGLVVVQSGTFSFYEDREGTRPIAKDCRYILKGTARDPRWYGTGHDQSTTEIWSLYELASGPPACQGAFRFLAIRPPEGYGRLRHMHLRHGGVETSHAALVAMSAGEEPTADHPCDPWWAVYCLRGYTGCDQD